MITRDPSSTLKAACALIETETQRGTGYLISSRWLLTCWHVVSEATAGTVSVTLGQRKQRARVINSDPERDCALIALDESVPDVEPLQLASDLPSQKATWESYGFPAAMVRSGILISGRVQDLQGQDLAERPALVLSSSQVTAGAELQGFSGSPVVSDGKVVGQLRQIVPDRSGGAQYGVLFACSAISLRALLPSADGLGGSPPERPSAEAGRAQGATRWRRGAPGALWRWLGLLVALLGVAGFIAARLLARQASVAAVRDLRLRLNTLSMKDSVPETPAACQTQDARLLVGLLHASELLSGSGVRSNRPADRQALAQLTMLAADTKTAPAAELQALLAHAHLAVDADGEAAFQSAQRAIALCPSLALAHNFLGNAEQLRSRPLAAAVSYRQALALAPGYLAPRLNLGLVALRLGDAPAALAALDELLRLDPDYPQAHLARGQARLLVGNAAGAESDLAHAARVTPERSEVWLLLGQARLSQNKTAEALAAFCQAKKLGSPEGTARCSPAP